MSAIFLNFAHFSGVRFKKHPCMVAKCDESYSDAEQLQRHMQQNHNHHQQQSQLQTHQQQLQQQHQQQPQNNHSQQQQGTNGNSENNMPLQSNFAGGGGAVGSGRMKCYCYYEGCNRSFDSAEQLDEHLIQSHNMQYKDVEARNKMNLILFEQLKRQMAEQYVSSLSNVLL